MAFDFHGLEANEVVAHLRGVFKHPSLARELSTEASVEDDMDFNDFVFDEDDERRVSRLDVGCARSHGARRKNRVEKSSASFHHGRQKQQVPYQTSKHKLVHAEK